VRANRSMCPCGGSSAAGSPETAHGPRLPGWSLRPRPTPKPGRSVPVTARNEAAEGTAPCGPCDPAGCLARQPELRHKPFCHLILPRTTPTTRRHGDPVECCHLVPTCAMPRERTRSRKTEHILAIAKSPARAFPGGCSDRDRYRNRDQNDRLALLPEMKQQKARRRVGRAFPPDVWLDSRSCDISHSAISSYHEQPISEATRRPRGMLPFSANLCHAQRTNKKPENRACSRERQRHVRRHGSTRRPRAHADGLQVVPRAPGSGRGRVGSPPRCRSGHRPDGPACYPGDRSDRQAHQDHRFSRRRNLPDRHSDLHGNMTDYYIINIYIVILYLFATRSGTRLGRRTGFAVADTRQATAEFRGASHGC